MKIYLLWGEKVKKSCSNRANDHIFHIFGDKAIIEFSWNRKHDKQNQRC